MRRKSENPVLQKMYESMCETLRTALMFTCACCGMTKPRKHAEGVHVFRPPNDFMRNCTNPAVYVLCDECAGMPHDKQQRQVTEYMAKQGLFKDSVIN